MLLFQYDPSIRRDHPGLATGVLEVDGVTPLVDAAAVADPPPASRWSGWRRGRRGSSRRSGRGGRRSPGWG